MRVNRAKKVLYGLPGKITVGSSTKIVELAPIRTDHAERDLNVFVIG
jgi:hypothetical protein